MRCKMCGAKLKKEGNICKKCYQIYKKEQELKENNEPEVFSIKRKYSIKFNLLSNFEVIVFALIIILSGYSYYSVWIGILITILTLVAFGVWMFYNKRRALGTKITFYETKFKYVAKYWFVNKEEYVAYNDIKDIAYFQSHSQKICKIGDIRFYTKGFLSGLTMHDIPEIEENFENIKAIINESRG